MSEKKGHPKEIRDDIAKAKRLDDTAAEVSRRLVVAMETVNEVLKDA